MDGGEKTSEQEKQSANLIEQPIQMIVAIDQAESLIAQGWRFVATLPKGKAVMEKNGVRMKPV